MPSTSFTLAISTARSARSLKPSCFWMASRLRLDRCWCRCARLSPGLRTENMVLLCGQYGGDVVFSGHGAGGHPTAVAVVSDLISLAHGSRSTDLPSRAATQRENFSCATISASSAGSARNRGRNRRRFGLRAHQHRRALSASRLRKRPSAVRGHRRAVRRFRAAPSSRSHHPHRMAHARPLDMPIGE